MAISFDLFVVVTELFFLLKTKWKKRILRSATEPLGQGPLNV
jgi:hypothetical protein